MLHKPYWTQGLELTAHHFQAVDRYHEDLIDQRLEALFDHTWGIREIAWDARGIASGHVALKRLDAILPDGTPILCDADDRAGAPSLTIRDFGTKNAVEVYAGIRL